MSNFVPPLLIYYPLSSLGGTPFPPNVSRIDKQFVAGPRRLDFVLFVHPSPSIYYPTPSPLSTACGEACLSQLCLFIFTFSFILQIYLLYNTIAFFIRCSFPNSYFCSILLSSRYTYLIRRPKPSLIYLVYGWPPEGFIYPLDFLSTPPLPPSLQRGDT